MNPIPPFAIGVYHGHLFPSNMRALAVGLDDMRAQALADHTRTKDGLEVIGLSAQ
jgi:hypothetical protein